VRPDCAGARRLLAAYLETTAEFARLCGLACLDARGPRYAPEALMEALRPLRSRQGKLGRGGDDAAVEEAIAHVFGAGAGRLMEVLRRGDEAASAPAASEPAAPVRGAEASVTAALEGLATLQSQGDLTPMQRDYIQALVLAVLRGRAEAPPGEGGAATLHTIATLLARTGPTLTEDAWDWIAREEDAELLQFLTALAALDDAGAELGLVRRALFENRCICRFALGVLQADANRTGVPHAAGPPVTVPSPPPVTEPEGQR
jgi:hypothetical protein